VALFAARELSIECVLYRMGSLREESTFYREHILYSKRAHSIENTFYTVLFVSVMTLWGPERGGLGLWRLGHVLGPAP
jgi:hypothetical protein